MLLRRNQPGRAGAADPAGGRSRGPTRLDVTFLVLVVASVLADSLGYADAVRRAWWVALAATACQIGLTGLSLLWRIHSALKDRDPETGEGRSGSIRIVVTREPGDREPWRDSL